MLYDRWLDIVEKQDDEIALWHPQCVEGLSFTQIVEKAEKIDVDREFLPAYGDSLDFFPTLVASWKNKKPAVLLEGAKQKIQPIRGEIPEGTILIKQTCGASGVERSLFFGEKQVLAEGLRNIEGLGLHPDRRGLASISLAHSYGFGCLALPLLFGGVPVELLASPLPMFLQMALDQFDRGEKVFLPGVPALWKTWWQTKVTEHAAIDLALSAGAPLSLELERNVFEKSGLKIHNFYGTSETGALAFDRAHGLREDENFLGNLLPDVNVSIDQEQRIVAFSESTAIGADIVLETNEFLETEGYRTLDIGRLEDEHLFVSRCMGGAINVAGRKVSAKHVQAVIESLDEVKSAEVVGGPSRDFERFQEIQVKITMNGEADKRVLREKIRQDLESWEMPRQWEFIEQ